MATQPDTKWGEGWRNTTRWKHGRHLWVRWRGSYWLATVDGDQKPTHHASRESAMRAAERRAKKETTK